MEYSASRVWFSEFSNLVKWHGGDYYLVWEDPTGTRLP